MSQKSSKFFSQNSGLNKISNNGHRGFYIGLKQPLALGQQEFIKKKP